MKTKAYLKAEMLGSIKETDKECDAKPNEIDKRVARFDNALNGIKQWEEVIKIIELLIKQGCI